MDKLLKVAETFANGNAEGREGRMRIEVVDESQVPARSGNAKLTAYVEALKQLSPPVRREHVEGLTQPGKEQRCFRRKTWFR